MYIYYIWVVLNGGYCFDAGIHGVRLNMGFLARALKREFVIIIQANFPKCIINFEPHFYVISLNISFVDFW